MRTRCPGSTFRGLARLEAYRWIINGRGYANVVEVESREESVWGMVYALTPRDEARLDVNEGVPVAYTKEMMQVEFWPVKGREDGGGKLDVSGEPPEQTEMLVYVDRVRVEPDVPKKEVSLLVVRRLSWCLFCVWWCADRVRDSISIA